MTTYKKILLISALILGLAGIAYRYAVASRFSVVPATPNDDSFVRATSTPAALLYQPQPSSASSTYSWSSNNVQYSNLAMTITATSTTDGAYLQFELQYGIDARTDNGTSSPLWFNEDVVQAATTSQVFLPGVYSPYIHAKSSVMHRIPIDTTATTTHFIVLPPNIAPATRINMSIVGAKAAIFVSPQRKQEIQ